MTAPLSNRNSSKRIRNGLNQNIYGKLFRPHLELVPQLNEVYELELAYYESKILSDEEIVQNGAYFGRVGDVLTRHFLMCSGEPIRLPRHSSSRLRAFFQSNQFKTGYATHGLFPYRGKFHPQMIKALINIMGLKKGDTIIDPMMGSGTVLIEAALMGINSIGIDVSPFCRFMAQAKLNALTQHLDASRTALKQAEAVFEYFASASRHGEDGTSLRNRFQQGDLFAEDVAAIDKVTGLNCKGKLPDGCDSPETHDFLLLAYLDSAGYAERSNRKSPYEQFEAILERYIFVAEKIQRVLNGLESELGQATALEGDARSLPLDDNSIDGALFSPPYSFAIDYLKNDSFHLDYFGCDLNAMRGNMIGLRGESLRQKYKNYKSDMEQVLSELSRVLQPGCMCTIVVGTNNNQLSKILDIPVEEVPGIDELIVELGCEHRFQLARKLNRQITGMANTMRTEFIVMLQKV